MCFQIKHHRRTCFSHALHTVLVSRDASKALPCRAGAHTLDILVENMGRVNYGKPHVLNAQRKGSQQSTVAAEYGVFKPKGEFSVFDGFDSK